ncbi:hypothetical protein NHX12_011308, partial [Muraenolepis orangiensis]
VEKVNCVIETGITKNGQRRVIHSLLSGTGQEITEPSQIRRRAVSFYSTLYASEYEEGETLSEGFWNGLPQVSEEANSQLEGPLTIQELQTALQGMQGRRAPGIDGLSVEFYKAYWDVLSNDLLDVFNESLASGSMPVSCRRAVITLLPKKGNLQDIKNWRPVSLLCVDYKLLSKALATRLGRAVEQVIHRDQTYCVPGRSMVDNVHLIRDVLEVSSSLDINTGLISLDQEKAFDRVEHSFLWKVMEKFGFSAGFIAKIMVLYNNIESVLKFNGGLCAPFRVCRGVRQGCALSGMLYALSLEPLLSKIRSKLQGLFLPGFNGNLVLSAYADDVVVFVRDQTDIDVLVDIVREFSSASAARVNWKKSEALAVGEWSGGLPVLPQNMVWRKDGFKYLGVFLGKEIVVLKNWEDVTERIEGKLSKLDVSNSETPGLTVALCRSKTLCLQQLVDAVGPELSDAQALGSLLGLHSVRVAQRILQLWSQILCPEEKRLLRSYGQGGARPDPADPFPEIYLSPGLGELTGPLLQLIKEVFHFNGARVSSYLQIKIIIILCLIRNDADPANPDSLPNPTTANPDSLPNPTTANPDSLLNPTTANPDSLPNPTTANPDSLPNPTTANPDSLPNPTTANPDSLPNPTTANPDSLPNPTTANSDSLPNPTTANPDSLPNPTTANPDSLPNPTTANPDSLPNPTTANPDSLPNPTTANPDSLPNPTTANPDSLPNPTCCEELVPSCCTGCSGGAASQ